MTTSFTTKTLSNVCFVVFPLTLLAGEKINVGGFEPKTLKKLKGDKLVFPSSSIELANAIGLGATAPKRYECSFSVAISLGIIVSIFSYFYALKILSNLEMSYIKKTLSLF